jgi:hypothetical protein
MALVLRYATAAQLADAFRERYRASSKQECARMATWILNRIDAVDFTDTQVRNAFGLTTGQYTTIKARWTNLRTAYNAMLAAQGE